MNFVVGLLKVQRGYDVLWMLMDRLTKTAHFIPIKGSITTDQLQKLYVKEIVRLHRVP